jgi:hypothetical protein
MSATRNPIEAGRWEWFSAGSAAYGGVNDSAAWREAIEEFYWDRLEPAFAMAETLGAGSAGRYEGIYRWIEAEARTRHASTQRVHLAWLTLETVDHECHGVEHIGVTIEAACNDVADRFKFKERPKAMVTVLALETDAPWAVGRYGYMVDKYPFDKICIPNRAIHSDSGLRSVVSHEFAHVMVLNAAQGRVPRWMDEGIAMLAERSADPAARRAFATGESPWLSPHDLEITHLRDRQGEPDPGRTHRAYAQSALLVQYLASISGEARIMDLLGGFVDNSTWTELRMRATGQSYADEALRETFGFGERELFDHTLAWIKT